ncbi:hypothetical protein [Luteolibacter luteus]|uniref:Virion morphogenesis protein n=1 Tax=Luteolibacter luteus TaxID=2728835 RepID=A0A858RFS9_9BACT|nr:hypothetical protein [Luteolibacter luteus]QJE95966.1 hypothetical protein HHL09_09285 [Luteolibacter luteus]
MKVTVSLTDGAGPKMKRLISMLTGEQATALNAVAGRAAVLRSAEYHRIFEARGGWENPALPTHGPGRESTGFGTKVADSWFLSVADRDGATIANDAPHLGHKVRGGKITPKRVQFLTIPVVPEAHGKRAVDYEMDYGTDLFTIKGRMGLFERAKTGSESVINRTYGRRKNGQKIQISARGHIRMVYAFSKGVDQTPWPGALPPTGDIKKAYGVAWRRELIDKLKR